jgi:hypothetical protein
MVYIFPMDSQKPRKKPGPVPKGFQRHNIFLLEEDAAWAKAQPEGLSGLVRLLLTQERQRREHLSS